MKKLFFAPAMMLAAACASVTPSTRDYFEASQAPIANSTNSASNFDTVWDGVVAKLSQSFFVINNIDKQSRIINVSFSTQNPERYVDCGRSKRSFSFQEKTAVFDYQVAASSTYKVMTTWNSGSLPAVVTVARSTKLEGRANVYIAPSDTAGTVVSVNAIYIWTVSVDGNVVGYNAFGAPGLLNQRLPSEAPTIVNFTTKEGGSSGNGEERISCLSNGEFEKSILAFVPK